MLENTNTIMNVTVGKTNKQFVQWITMGTTIYLSLLFDDNRNDDFSVEHITAGNGVTEKLYVPANDKEVTVIVSGEACKHLCGTYKTSVEIINGVFQSVLRK